MYIPGKEKYNLHKSIFYKNKHKTLYILLNVTSLIFSYSDSKVTFSGFFISCTFLTSSGLINTFGLYLYLCKKQIYIYYSKNGRYLSTKHQSNYINACKCEEKNKIRLNLLACYQNPKQYTFCLLFVSTW